MATATVYDMQGNQVGEMELDPNIFDIKVNEEVLHQVVVKHLAGKRFGTASTRTRGEVRGGGRKPWRQKGTGRARAGSTRSPLWRHGGTTFGPKPRDYSFTLPRKLRRLALKSALSAMAQSGNLVIIDEISLAEPKTRKMVEFLRLFNADSGALVVTSDKKENVEKSVRNIPGVTSRTIGGLSVYELLNHRKLVMARDAVTRAQEVLA